MSHGVFFDFDAVGSVADLPADVLWVGAAEVVIVVDWIFRVLEVESQDISGVPDANVADVEADDKGVVVKGNSGEVLVDVVVSSVLSGEGVVGAGERVGVGGCISK